VRTHTRRVEIPYCPEHWKEKMSIPPYSSGASKALKLHGLDEVECTAMPMGSTEIRLRWFVWY